MSAIHLPVLFTRLAAGGTITRCSYDPRRYESAVARAWRLFWGWL